MLALEASAGCPVATFGAEKFEPCRRDKCRISKPAPEIEQMRRGVYFEYVSLELGAPPRTWWLALDVEKGELIDIQQYPMRAYEQLRQAKGPADTRVVVRKVRGKVAEYVRRRAVAQDKVEEAVCLANKLWKSKDDDDTVSYVTDAATHIYVVDGKQARDLGGLGLAAGEAKTLEDLLRSLKPNWNWWDISGEK